MVTSDPDIKSRTTANSTGQDTALYRIPLTCGFCGGDLELVIGPGRKPIDESTDRMLCHISRGDRPADEIGPYFSQLCEACGADVQDLTQHWTAHPGLEAAEHRRTDPGGECPCSFCGDAVAVDDEFRITQIYWGPEPTLDGPAYLLCGGCDGVYRTFLEQLRAEHRGDQA